jgi:hypothetical protein
LHMLSHILDNHFYGSISIPLTIILSHLYVLNPTTLSKAYKRKWIVMQTLVVLVYSRMLSFECHTYKDGLKDPLHCNIEENPYK